MAESNYNNTLVRLLVSPRYRIVRHLVLFVMVFVISINFILYMEEDGTVIPPLPKYFGMLFYAVMLMLASCINIYILTPRFLLKDKWLRYFLYLFGLVVIVIILIVSAQTFFYERSDPEKSNFPKGIVSLISSSFAFFFLFAGTTSLVLFKHWILDMQRAKELESTTLQSELKMLKSQINPHFLFNTLNNANIMIDENADLASRILVKLKDLLRYQINDSFRDRVRLDDDIKFLADYLELEKTRRDHFEYSIKKEGASDVIQIPPLLFIPFVENAVKHNSDSEALSYVNLSFKVEGGKLSFFCENSIPQKAGNRRERGGLGLANIKRRLDLLFADKYCLKQEKTETKYIVHLDLNI